MDFLRALYGFFRELLWFLVRALGWVFPLLFCNLFSSLLFNGYSLDYLLDWVNYINSCVFSIYFIFGVVVLCVHDLYQVIPLGASVCRILHASKLSCGMSTFARLEEGKKMELGFPLSLTFPMLE